MGRYRAGRSQPGHTGRYEQPEIVVDDLQILSHFFFRLFINHLFTPSFYIYKSAPLGETQLFLNFIQQ